MTVAVAENTVSGIEYEGPATIERAAEFVRGGQLAEAEAAYAAIVAASPDFPDAWFLYGLTALESGDPRAAVDRLRRAVQMRRAEPRYRIMLARACTTAGLHDEAVTALEAAVRLLPDAPDVNAALGQAYMAAGRPSDAAVYSGLALRSGLRNVLRRSIFAVSRLSVPLRVLAAKATRNGVPWHASASFERGRIAERFRQVAIASQWYQRAADEAPHWPAPLVQLARIAFDAEQFRAARVYLENASERAPDAVDVQAAYGRVLSRMAYHDDAREVLSSALDNAPGSLDVLCQLGWACYRDSDTKKGLEHFGKVLQRLPENVDAHFGTACCHADLGDADEAMKWFEHTLALNPGHAGAFRALANMKALKPADRVFVQLERMAQSPDTFVRRRCIMNLALGEVYRNQGDPAKAFEHYDLGNALKDVTFDIDTYRRYLDRIMKQYDAAHFGRVAGQGDNSEVPVFIVGMPRSGTSLVEQILASHPAVYGAGEREEIGRLAGSLPDVIGCDAPYPECVDRLAAGDITALASELLKKLDALAPGAERITDKMPGNFLHLGLIATLYPNARIIHCQRDPLDVCLSIFFGEFAGSHGYAYNLENLGLYYREYERIMRYWSETLASRMFTVRYEDVVDDVESIARRLLEFCDLPWDARCLEFHKTERTVHTRSKTQVRQPIYSSSRGRWRPYAAYLGPLADALGGDTPVRLAEAVGDNKIAPG